MPLGLTSSEQLDDYWSSNTRRRVFYDHPNGTAPLTGLLSMMETEETPLPEFGWNEERWQTLQTTTAAGPAVTGNKTGPFATSGSTTASGDTDGIFSLASQGAIRLYVANAADFQIDTVIKLFNVGSAASGTTATSYKDLAFRVVAYNTDGADYLELEAVQAYTDILNGTTYSVGKYVVAMGSAYAEGARSRTGRIKFPYEIKNFTQIHKTPFELTRTALKEPLKYDKSGAYQSILKSTGIDHLAQIEYSLFFGVRGYQTAVDPDTGSVVPRRFMGGLEWFLQQYEIGTAYGQTDISAETDWRTYTRKRIIDLGGLTITSADFNELNSRVFEKTNSSSWDKLVLCGAGYLNKVADKFERQIQWTSLRENGFTGFDFELTKHSTNAGTVYYKTHPLFNEPWMRNSAFYIDLGYLAWRPLTDSDTDIQPMIQLPDADKRKDQWITEGGCEFHFPEAFMYVKNLGGVSV